MADDPEIPLQLILKTCPDLVHLKCQTATVISGFQDTYPKLRTLELHQVRGTIDNQHTTMMKQHLPNLNILNMAIMHSLRPLTAEDTWIPAIRHLTYGDYPSGGCSQRAKFKPYEQQGLVTFSIVPGNHLFALDDIAPFIIHHHATLQLLELKCDLNTTHTVKMADTMKNNLQIEFTRLKKIAAFTISHVTNMHSYSFFLTWIVQRAPYLHEITLYGYIISEYTIRTLAKCEHLRTVLFDTGTNQRPDDYDRLVAEFVRDHVNHMADKGGSRLQILQVRLHRAAPMLIDAFRGLKSLTTFHLFTNDLASEPFVRLFESVHQGSHHLEALHIGNSGTMTNRVLYQISRNQNLRHLTISGNMSDAQAGVLSLQACRHLSHLTSYWPIDEDIQSILKEKTSCIISAPSRLD